MERFFSFFSFFFCVCLWRLNQMMVVAGDYSLAIYEGTEQEILPQVLVPHPQYNTTTNNNDIMLIKVAWGRWAWPRLIS